MAGSSRGLYSILGTSSDASHQELKSSYQKQFCSAIQTSCHNSAVRQTETQQCNSSVRLTRHGEHCNDISRKAYDASHTEQELRRPLPLNEEVFLEDMDWQEDDEIYTYSCRCGGEYIASDKDIEQNISIISCNTCTLSIQLVYSDTNSTVQNDSQPT